MSYCGGGGEGAAAGGDGAGSLAAAGVAAVVCRPRWARAVAAGFSAGSAFRRVGALGSAFLRTRGLGAIWLGEDDLAPGAPPPATNRAVRAFLLSRCAGCAYEIGRQRGGAFAAVGVMLAQEAGQPALALTLGQPLRPLVASTAGAIGVEQRGRRLGAEILAPRYALGRRSLALLRESGVCPKASIAPPLLRRKPGIAAGRASCPTL